MERWLLIAVLALLCASALADLNDVSDVQQDCPVNYPFPPTPLSAPMQGGSIFPGIEYN